jgi:hypothetical protein
LLAAAAAALAVVVVVELVVIEPQPGRLGAVRQLSLP